MTMPKGWKSTAEDKARREDEDKARREDEDKARREIRFPVDPFD